MGHNNSGSPTILGIETSCSMLSVALLRGEEIVYSRSTEASGERNLHASLCAVFIDEALKSAGISASELSAVALSSGPGSYTGLRVGCSSAKGLCFGANVPLIAVPTTEILAHQASSIPTFTAETIVIPMIDARRMEVYTATYRGGVCIEEVHPQVVEQNTFEGIEGGIFIGDGAAKCAWAIGERGLIVETYPSAEALLTLAVGRLEKKLFADVAYFEPFYLKDFVATESKKKLF